MCVDKKVYMRAPHKCQEQIDVNRIQLTVKWFIIAKWPKNIDLNVFSSGFLLGESRNLGNI